MAAGTVMQDKTSDGERQRVRVKGLKLKEGERERGREKKKQMKKINSFHIYIKCTSLCHGDMTSD